MESFLRDLLKPLSDRLAVNWLEGGDCQNQHIECPLQELGIRWCWLTVPRHSRYQDKSGMPRMSRYLSRRGMGGLNQYWQRGAGSLPASPLFERASLCVG